MIKAQLKSAYFLKFTIFVELERKNYSSGDHATHKLCGAPKDKKFQPARIRTKKVPSL